MIVPTTLAARAVMRLVDDTEVLGPIEITPNGVWIEVEAFDGKPLEAPRTVFWTWPEIRWFEVTEWDLDDLDPF